MKNLTPNKISFASSPPSPTTNTWVADLPERLRTWKRTANTGYGRKNSKSYRDHKQKLRLWFRDQKVPSWGKAWVELELHVYLTDMRSHGDWDNYGKIVSDALQEILYDDDRQVIAAHVYKHLAAGAPRVVVAARRLPSLTGLPDLSPRFAPREEYYPTPGEVFEHMNGGRYLILSVGEIDISHGGEVVRYVDLEDGERYVRQLPQFLGKKDGTPRFVRCELEEDAS